jgi:TrmH RNA methyltransferase
VVAPLDKIRAPANLARLMPQRPAPSKTRGRTPRGPAPANPGHAPFQPAQNKREPFERRPTPAPNGPPRPASFSPPPKGAPSAAIAPFKGSSRFDSYATKGVPRFDAAASKGGPRFEPRAPKGAPRFEPRASKGAPRRAGPAPKGAPRFDAHPSKSPPRPESSALNRPPRPEASASEGAPRSESSAPKGAPRDHSNEIKVCGRHACRALFERRPQEILRVYLTEEMLTPFGDLAHDCAERRRPYRVVSAEELERITESRHHEGICIVAAAASPPSLAEILRAPGPGWLVALAGVANPHNTGAIVRTAANFGARAVLVEGVARRLPPAVYRTAQGGAEWVDVVTVPALVPALGEVKRAGYTVCATSSHGGTDLFAAELPPRTVIVLGAEDEGLPPALASAADLTLRIPGSGRVESLNVAAATAVLLGDLWRRHPRAQ